MLRIKGQVSSLSVYLAHVPEEYQGLGRYIFNYLISNIFVKYVKRRLRRTSDLKYFE